MAYYVKEDMMYAPMHAVDPRFVQSYTVRSKRIALVRLCLPVRVSLACSLCRVVLDSPSAATRRTSKLSRVR
jgi:hypothetical protein